MPVTTKGKPGRDEHGNYWFDCGCMINAVMSKRCPLHEAASEREALLTVVVEALEGLLREKDALNIWDDRSRLAVKRAEATLLKADAVRKPRR
jgi:hypothetical protein